MKLSEPQRALLAAGYLKPIAWQRNMTQVCSCHPQVALSDWLRRGKDLGFFVGRPPRLTALGKDVLDITAPRQGLTQRKTING